MQGIFIRGLRASARVGVKPDELDREQDIELDVELTHDAPSVAADTGRLRDTLDYRHLAEITQQVTGRQHYRLVETLASEIAKVVLQQTGAEAVRIRLNKLGCVPGATGAGVELTLDADTAIGHPSPVEHQQLQAKEPVLIVGGGPAGLAASLWCHRLGVSALVVDPCATLGGQLHLVHSDMPDLPAHQPMSGHALARRLTRQFVGHRGRWVRARLVEVTPDAPSQPHRVTLQLHDQGQRQLAPAALIIATGVRRRQLDVPGEAALAGRGILDTASSGTRQLAGQRVLVVGGGDAACENALKLAEAGCQVVLAMRRPHLSAGARLRRQVQDNPQIQLRCETNVTRFEGDTQLEGVTFADGTRLEVQRALVRIGWLPNSQGIPREWLDDLGFLRCDTQQRVIGQQRIFAAGDIRAPNAPSVAAAQGDGACAAKAAVALGESL